MIRNLFYIGIILSASGLISPPIALAGGLIFGLTTIHHFHVESRNLSKFLLQAAVVCLGFGMNLQEVVHAGKSGFIYTAISITFALSLGVALGKLLKVQQTQSLLIAFGTAICGGSAIAAIGPVLEANEEEMAVSLGTVFVLNSVALLTFPAIGWALHLSQTQFGLWAALAIHDTSSVVGAGAKYGPTALAVGTTVKLARALWIVPLAIATASIRKSKTRIHWPWFILYFCGAAVLATYVPHFLPQSVPFFGALNRLGRAALTVVLFLIGTGITRTTLREVGVRPLIQGITLWIVVASLSLYAIARGWIAL
ncbi:putative integral membrane protein (TIGR00698 family) [Granulicella aggregans]|uniref:Putative integral membrane protein (TIGR00698 family) n=1 Tax=Granulicella aggregans TaxID=474949 RepID=A0A7W8E2Q4_9BACT|nr:putative sulfate exporter family transporter [Granulicella aggregans]MBB5056792.1 putative integral membrane protein (TIGR00698 family) [Granulicella aggregans]